MSTHDGPLDRLRRPEYTGENRCLPCTALNTAISVVLAVLLAIVWVPLGIASFLVFAGAIYFRGYLIPGTPTITQRYFPEWILRAFGKEPVEVTRPAGTTEATDPKAVTPDTEAETDAETSDEDRDIEGLLSTAGVVEECIDTDDLCLSDRFSDVWWRRIRRLREDTDAAREHLGAVLDVEPDGLDFDESGSRFAVTFEDDRIGVWDSDAAFYADLAVEPTLDEWISDWGSLSDRERTQLIAGMRAFLERCPSCESEVEQAENVRKTCCSSKVVGVDVDCPECGARVFSGRY